MSATLLTTINDYSSLLTFPLTTTNNHSFFWKGGYFTLDQTPGPNTVSITVETDLLMFGDRTNMDINLFTDTDDETRQIQQLYRRINKLGVVDRAIILLWLENMSYEEIGQIIGISTKNVSVKLVRIKEQLKKMSNE